MRAAFLLLFSLLLTGCDAVPADPEHTLFRIKESGQLRAGIVEGAPSGTGEGFVQKIASRTGASPQSEHGEAEHLLKKLENGQLDIVIGSFAQKSPWMRQVWISPPLHGGKPAGDEPVLRAAACSGENRWIMAIADAVRQP